MCIMPMNASITVIAHSITIKSFFFNDPDNSSGLEFELVCYQVVDLRSVSRDSRPSTDSSQRAAHRYHSCCSRLLDPSVIPL
jgi:hypothetical protein